MADVIAYAEFRDGALRPVARETVSAARALADELGGGVVAVALGGPGSADAALELANFGADRILTAEHADLTNYHPDAAVQAIKSASEATEAAAIVFPASARGKDLAARVAGRLNRSLATEVTELGVEDGSVVVTRPVYAGKAYAKLRFRAAPALISIRPNVFPVVERQGGGIVETLDIQPADARTRVTGIEGGARERLDVREADIVVAGGRGLQAPEHWAILDELVDALGPLSLIHI